jgi:ribosome biogenesis protein Nip4
MNETKNFRQINKTEKNLIFKSLSEISPDIISDLERDGYQLFISFNKLSNKYKLPTIYLVSSNIAKDLNTVKSYVDIIAAGLYFGFIKKDSFIISLEAVGFFQGCFSQGQVLYVTKKGEKSVLYGNQILKKMISKIPKNMKRNDFILIFNQEKEMISIAKSEVSNSIYQKLKENDIVASNLVDKGIYLRRKQ